MFTFTFDKIKEKKKSDCMYEILDTIKKIEDIKELSKVFPDDMFVVIGRGTEALEGIENIVRVPFTNSAQELAQYYSMADVFVNASTSETQGLTYIEAAANGLPLLCRKDPCLDEVIKDGINGYEYTSLEEFEEYLNDILMDSEWRKAAAVQSEKIAEAFGKERFVESVETIYEEVAV